MPRLTTTSSRPMVCTRVFIVMLCTAAMLTTPLARSRSVLSNVSVLLYTVDVSTEIADVLHDARVPVVPIAHE